MTHKGLRVVKPQHNLYIVPVVHLSLLTMTNPNQLCDVFETNLSSELPVAGRTRDV